MNPQPECLAPVDLAGATTCTASHSRTASPCAVIRTWQRLALVAIVACTMPALAATVIIDVRTPAEYASGHVDGAINIEYQLIGQQIVPAGVRQDDTVILYCRSGRRSAIALETLRALGFRGVADYGTIESARQKLANRRG